MTEASESVARPSARMSVGGSGKGRSMGVTVAQRFVMKAAGQLAAREEIDPLRLRHAKL